MGLGSVLVRRSLVEPDWSAHIAGVELSGGGDRLVGGGDDLVGVHIGRARAAGSADWPRFWRRVVQATPSYQVSPCSIAISASPWDLVPTFKPALPIGGFLAQCRLGIQG